MTTARAPESRSTRSEKTRRRGASIDWVPEIRVPLHATLSADEEIRLGHEVQCGLARLRGLLLAHPGGLREHLRRMNTVRDEREWVFGWIPHKERFERDLETATRELRLADARGETRPELARRRLRELGTTLERYTLEPEMVLETARALVEDPDGDPLASCVDARRLAAVISRCLVRVERASDRLVESNLRLVLKNSLSYRPRGQTLADLYQEGTLGLHRATLRFHPSHQVRFATYAVHWIRRGIRKSIKDSSRVIRVPDRVQRRLAAGDERLSAKEAERVTKILHQTVFLNSVESDDDSTPIEISDPGRSLHEDEKLRLREIPSAVAEAVSLLSDREQLILKRRFGLDGSDRHTLEDCGALLSLSRERVRQIERRALDRLASVENLEELFGSLAERGVASR